MKKLFFFALCLMVGISSVDAQSKRELKKQQKQIERQQQYLQNQQVLQQQQMMMQQQQVQGYPQQQVQGYPQQPVQGYPQQQVGVDPDGYSQEIQKSRIELLQFANPEKLRAMGVDESREKQSAINIAEEQARAQMQRQIEAFTKDALERYRKETAMDDAEKYQANDEQLSQTVAKGILTGCKVVDYATYYNQATKKYKVEVLVEYDKAGVMGLIESQEAQIMANRAKFEAHMQDVFDEYEIEKTGSTAAQKKQMAEDAMNNKRLDAQAVRDAASKQQDADNALRQQESNQIFILNSQKQAQETAVKMQKQKIDGEVLKSNVQNQEIDN